MNGVRFCFRCECDHCVVCLLMILMMTATASCYFRPFVPLRVAPLAEQLPFWGNCLGRTLKLDYFPSRHNTRGPQIPAVKLSLIFLFSLPRKRTETFHLCTRFRRRRSDFPANTLGRRNSPRCWLASYAMDAAPAPELNPEFLYAAVCFGCNDDLEEKRRTREKKLY